MNLIQNDVKQNFSIENDKISLIFRIVDSIKEILEEDKAQAQPLFLSINEQFILKLVKTIINLHKRTYLIGITGESASGKTTLVENAAKAFERFASNSLFTTVSCDDYYFDTSEELKKAGSYEELFLNGFTLDTPNAINLELMKAHLISLKNNCGVNAPYYDFVTCESKPNTIWKKPAHIVLNEGLYVLHKDVVDVHDIKVYVFTPFNIIKDRWYTRAAVRGKVGKAADMQFADVNSTAQVYIRPTMQEADVVINGLTSAQYIEDLTAKVLNAINSIIENN